MTISRAKKVLIAGLCTATLGGTMVSFSDPAEARSRHRGGAVAAGVIGGLALGAIAAGSARSHYAPVAPGYAYPAYGVPAYGYGGGCYEVRRRYVDDWGRRFTRRETVCE